MWQRIVEFEGGAGASILKGYDPAANRWKFSFNSPFWKAVHHAHELGRRGQNSRVAIIDSGCNLEIPRLRQRVNKIKSFVASAADRDVLGHGTAIALLISEVAPECQLDIYQIAHDGKPDESAIVEALNEVAVSDANIINLSIAVRSPFQFTAEQVSEAISTGDGSGKRYALEQPPCRLCLAASHAIANGKFVFAAAGNKLGFASCPARVKEVVAVGFAGETRSVAKLKSGGENSASFGESPSSSQSLLLDLSLAQIPGVLGTSFAAPLFAGVGALGLSHQELSAYIGSIAAAGLPQLYHGLIDSKAMKSSAELEKRIGQWYVNAQRQLPHVHCEYQEEINSRVPCSDPASCYACGIFAEPILVNHGLWLLETGHTQSANSSLEAAVTVAPWSADATANLGATKRELGDLAGAIELFERALVLRPGFRVYRTELKRLTKRNHQSWWSRVWS